MFIVLIFMIAYFCSLYCDTAQRHELVILSQSTYRVIKVIIMCSVMLVLFRASSRRTGALEMSISINHYPYY